MWVFLSEKKILFSSFKTGIFLIWRFHILILCHGRKWNSSPCLFTYSVRSCDSSGLIREFNVWQMWLDQLFFEIIFIFKETFKGNGGEEINRNKEKELSPGSLPRCPLPLEPHGQPSVLPLRLCVVQKLQSEPGIRCRDRGKGQQHLTQCLNCSANVWPSLHC